MLNKRQLMAYYKYRRGQLSPEEPIEEPPPPPPPDPPDDPTPVTTRLAFPGATGFGKHARGGYTTYEATKVASDLPDIYFVTTLNDNGLAGSLSYALKQSGDRIIIFKVGGTIALNSTLIIESGNVTLAGFTAPGGGICLTNKQIAVRSSNIIIRNIRQRPKIDIAAGTVDGFGISATTTRGFSNVIIDHVSVSWCSDEAFGINASNNPVSKITIQNSLICEGLHGHGFSMLANGDQAETGKGKPKEVSYHRNVMITMEGRNPKFGDTVSGTSINNLCYNWRSIASEYGGSCIGDILYNRYKRGPWNIPENIGHKVLVVRYDQTGTLETVDYEVYPRCQMYFKGNETPTGIDAIYYNNSYADGDLASVPHYSADDYGFEPQTNLAALESELLPHVGASPRDPLDTKWIAQYINNSANRTPLTVANPENYGIGGPGLALPALSAGTYPASHEATGIHLRWLVAKGYAASESAAASLTREFLMLPQYGKTGYAILEEFINDRNLYA